MVLSPEQKRATFDTSPPQTSHNHADGADGNDRKHVLAGSRRVAGNARVRSHGGDHLGEPWYSDHHRRDRPSPPPGIAAVPDGENIPASWFAVGSHRCVLISQHACCDNATW
jgi:hypothetical protein